MNCPQCGGIKLEPNQTHGYQGKVCYCGGNQLIPEDNRFTRPTWATEMLSRLDRIEKLLLEKS